MAEDNAVPPVPPATLNALALIKHAAELVFKVGAMFGIEIDKPLVLSDGTYEVEVRMVRRIVAPDRHGLAMVKPGR